MIFQNSKIEGGISETEGEDLSEPEEEGRGIELKGFENIHVQCTIYKHF